MRLISALELRDRLILASREGPSVSRPLPEGERMPAGGRVLDYRASDASSRIHRDE